MDKNGALTEIGQCDRTEPYTCPEERISKQVGKAACPDVLVPRLQIALCYK